MKSISKKYCVFGIIILFLSSTIMASSTSLTVQESNPKISSNEPKTLNSSLPEKISQAIDMINESMMRGFLEDLSSFGPRKTGTYGCEKAAEYIYNEFQDMGIKARYQHWESLTDIRPIRYYKSDNVIGTLEGKDKSYKDMIVFNAHYDSVKISPGANDDGSGVVAVLAAAYVLSNFEFNRTIEFALFSGEEQGLLGSRAHVEELYNNDKELLAEFNADMIGYAETKSGAENISISSTKDAKWIVDEIKFVNENSGINFNVRSSSGIEPYGPRTGSDFHDFVQYGYESVCFWESEWNKSYYHTENDTIEHINFDYLVNYTKLIVGSLACMADIENNYPQIRIGAPSRNALYFEGRTILKFKHERTWVFDDFLICTEVKPGDSPITKVEFYIDDKLMFTDTTIPYQWRLSDISIHKYMIKVIAYDEKGRNSTDQLRIFYFNINDK